MWARYQPPAEVPFRATSRVKVRILSSARLIRDKDTEPGKPMA